MFIFKVTFLCTNVLYYSKIANLISIKSKNTTCEHSSNQIEQICSMVYISSGLTIL